MPETEDVLRVEGIVKSFGGVRALAGVSLSASQGAVTAVIGPNGSGKTTLFNVVSGITKPDSGRVFLRGEEIVGLPPHRILAMGLARTFQNVRLFNSLSVAENVMVGAHSRYTGAFFDCVLHLPRYGREEARVRRLTREALALVGLDDVAGRRAGDLPYGKKKLVEIARALVSSPRVLLADEPSAGMNESETEQLRETLLGLAKRGISVLLVEHDMNLVMGVSTHIWVLDHGTVIASGSPDVVGSDARVLEAYLGAKRGRDDA